MKTLIRFAVVAAMAVLPAIASAGVSDIFVSFSGFGDGDAATNTMNVDLTEGSSGTAYIWVNDTFSLDTGAFLDITNTDTSVLQFTGATVFNPDIVVTGGTPVDSRWQSFDSGDITAGFIDELNAFAVTDGTGILPSQTTGNTFSDELHDPSSNAFLFASIDFDVVGEGSADIFLGIGDGLIVDDNVELSPNFGAANVLVKPAGIPEPTSAVVLMLGAFGLVARRRR